MRESRWDGRRPRRTRDTKRCNSRRRRRGEVCSRTRALPIPLRGRGSSATTVDIGQRLFDVETGSRDPSAVVRPKAVPGGRTDNVLGRLANPQCDDRHVGRREPMRDSARANGTGPLVPRQHEIADLQLLDGAAPVSDRDGGPRDETRSRTQRGAVGTRSAPCTGRHPRSDGLSSGPVHTPGIPNVVTSEKPIALQRETSKLLCGTSGNCR